jgi:hypothetical protein
MRYRRNQDFSVDNPACMAYLSPRVNKEVAMSDAQIKETIRQGYIDRQAAREASVLAERQAEVETAIANTVVENRMPIEDGVAFLRSGGEREDLA